MNYKWRTHSQGFMVNEASMYKEFSKDKYIQENADEYLIIFNICDPKYRIVNKSVFELTKIFIKKIHLDKSYTQFLMHKLDFNEEVIAREFRRYFNRMLKANKV